MLHKMVNGKKVELSEEEEANTRNQWKQNNDERLTEKEKKQQQLKALRAKLKLSPDEFNLIANR